MSPTFASLSVRNYRIWFFGALVSNIGTWMARVAQDWLVLTELTDHSASALGVMTRPVRATKARARRRILSIRNNPFR